MASNFRIDVSSEGREHFDMAMDLAWSKCPGGIAVCYRLLTDKGLILYWDHDGGGALTLPYQMNLSAAKEFVWGWLQTAEYGRQPDHDGDNKKGWRIYNEAWGHVADDWRAFVAIKPCWMMYGK